MMKNLKSIGAYFILTVALLMIFASLQAQPGGGGNPCPGGEPCDPEVPITGIEWLLVAGAALGIRKITARRRS